MHCENKHKHVDRQTANRAKERTNKQYHNYRATVYHCQACGFYHIGQRARLHRQQRITQQRKD